VTVGSEAMKLIIQIPCYNEEKTLPETIADLPRKVDGFDQVEFLIIDDGSTDKTIEVAKSLGVDHIVQQKQNQGLARTFIKGLEECVNRGADVIVNTDGDNQYKAEGIHKLTAPLVAQKADMVIGCRQMRKIKHFSLIKRKLQNLGSWGVRKVSGTSVRDATSGFRAFSKEMAMRLLVHSPYTYTLETIIQAGKRGLVIESVDIDVNPPTRKSRLMRSTFSYLKRSTLTILRVYSIYEPLKFFGYLSIPFFLGGIGLITRFLVHYFLEPDESRYTQSVVIGGVSLIVALLILLVGFLGDMMQSNRRLSEDILFRLRRLEHENKKNTNKIL